MSRKGSAVLKTLIAVAVLLLTFGEVQAQIQFLPASSQTDFYFAHITDGGTDSERWTTQFRIVNPTPFFVTGTLEFFAQDGTPLAVDVGSGPASVVSVFVLPGGSSRYETKGSSEVLRIGFVRGSFDTPVQATAEFRVWRNGVFANGASVNGIAPHKTFQTFADSFTGIAIANPNRITVSCTGKMFASFFGFIIEESTIFLPPLNQTAFTLGSSLSLSQASEGSYRLDCTEPVVSLAIAGNNKGITSSLPSGHFAFPPNHRSNIQRIFKHLVKNLNNAGDGFLAVGDPRLVIASNQRANAFASNNTVTIELGLAELLGDSPSELAWIIAHELGHIYQASNGLQFFTINSEVDADIYATFANLLSGYDPYAGAGVLGKLAMASGSTSLIVQIFENLFDPHTSFSNRIGTIFEVITLVCDSEVARTGCQEYHDIVHPHLPAPLRKEERVTQ